MSRWLCWIALARLASAADPNGAVIESMRHQFPALPNVTVLERVPAGQLDVVAALASRTGCQLAPRPCVWSLEERLAILVQEHGSAEHVDTLITAAGPNPDCNARLVHMSASELVIGCIGEKSEVYENQKFVYDAVSRKLIRRVAYAPFYCARILDTSEGPRIVLADNHRLVLAAEDGAGDLHVMSSGAARALLEQVPMVENRIGEETLHVPAPDRELYSSFGNGGRFHFAMERNQYGSEYPVLSQGQGNGRRVFPLPKTDLATWRQARAEEVGNYQHPDQAEMNEQIGPHQVEGSRLWFGKTFYDSEGATGVGGFGYFDTASTAYRLFAPPEMQAWSVSAILVEPDCIWLALEHRGEYGNDPGGLLRWDRKAATIQKYDLDSIVTALASSNGALYLGTRSGLSILKGGRMRHYFVDMGAGGAYQMVER